MKICLLGDTHFGVRNDNQSFHDHFEKFYSECFFPYLDEHGITTVVQFGDLFDRRKYINFATLGRSRQYFFDELKKRNIDFHVFVGNHDVYYKNTNDLNSPELLLRDYDNITVYSTPKVVSFSDEHATKYALLPWVCSGNYTECMDFIKQTDAPILFGHLELEGFEMYRGYMNDHGMQASVFDKFDLVCTGHFHHKSTRGNIHYLGTPYEMTWSDYNDPRGFHIFDEADRSLTFVRNPHTIFKKVYYDDTEMTMDDITGIDFADYHKTYVKVIVKNKTNPYWFDLFVTNLEKAGVSDLQVVEDHLNLDLEEDSDIVSEAEDTLTILRKYVDNLNTNVPKKPLEKLLTSLYNEAVYHE